MKRHVERLFTGSCRTPLSRLEKELLVLGFAEVGADPVAVAMENRAMECTLKSNLMVQGVSIVILSCRFPKRQKSSGSSGGKPGF